ncbi:MAG: 3-deoxy-D-manno-octulosonic acid transferase [Candidatus Omnitrophica bacterium]|nr:3-deoxy-D-manno-octulosonic acid transferase [Candidatus Omnitrophota bacterium]
MAIFYNLIFLLVSLVFLPLYLFKGKFHKGFSLRLGILPKGLKFNRPVWIHAVSVGEAATIKGLLAQLRNDFPQKQFVISTVTPTGNQIAKSLAREKDFVTYLPLDFSFIVQKVFRQINPEIAIIAETEIWPNLISVLFKKKIPIIIINGRISDHSFRGYLAIKLFLKPVLNKVTFFCVQSPRDKERLSALGVAEEKIKVTGNMKFDVSLPAANQLIPQGRIKEILGLKAGDRLFIAASTHSGEEEIILSAYQALLKNFPALKLLIAPRHPQRSKEIAAKIADAGFNPFFLSKINIDTTEGSQAKVFLLDTVGQLTSFFQAADLVFMGGSLIKKGGHNILEPAGLNKPVIFGPQMFNFRDIATLFLDSQAAILVHCAEEIAQKAKYLFEHPEKVKEMTVIAQKLIAQNQGATERNRKIIRDLLA